MTNNLPKNIRLIFKTFSSAICAKELIVPESIAINLLYDNL